MSFYLNQKENQMQYILTEQELEVYKRCKNLVRNDYNNILNLEEKGNTRIASMRKGMLEYALGIRHDMPNISEE
jgi:hypothetical protein